MNFEKLDESAKKSWMISRIIVLVVISAALIALRVLLNNSIGNKGLVFNIVIFAVIILMAVNAFIYPEIEYKQWEYGISEDSIELIHGIYFVEHTIIPVIRIQHIKTSQGPVNKELGLSTMEIYTAGGVHKIPNINKEKAETISRYIKDKVHVKAVKEMEGQEL